MTNLTNITNIIKGKTLAIDKFTEHGVDYTDTLYLLNNVYYVVREYNGYTSGTKIYSWWKKGEDIPCYHKYLFTTTFQVK